MLIFLSSLSVERSGILAGGTRGQLGSRGIFVGFKRFGSSRGSLLGGGVSSAVGLLLLLASGLGSSFGI